MNLDIAAALLVFVAVTLVTPGPNNAMLMSTGVTYGFQRGLPHLLGVALGFGFMTLAVGFGLGALLLAAPKAYTILKYAGAAYLLYLAWAIATATPDLDAEAGGSTPITFLQAALFQWLNPKAWVMAVGAISTYSGVASYPHNVLLIAGLFCLLGLFSSGLWLGFGTGLRRLLTSTRTVRLINLAMALLLVLSIWPVLAEGWH